MSTPRHPGTNSAKTAFEGFTGFSTRELDRLAIAHDASHYLLVPESVLTPADFAEVGRVMTAAAATGSPVVFRSGGTSLSGQALTDSVLVDTRRNFRSIQVLDGGTRVKLGPGVTVRSANAQLARYGRKLGPDPASESACTIGGVVANNSSGMACGTEFNSYHTLDSLVFVLPSGTVVDSADPQADQLLREREPELHEGLLRLRRRIIGNPDSVRTIERLFGMRTPWLRAELLPGFRLPGEDLGTSYDRLGGHPGIHRGGHLPNHPAIAARRHRPDHLSHLA